MCKESLESERKGLLDLEITGEDDTGWRKLQWGYVEICPYCREEVKWSFNASVKIPSWWDLLKADVKGWFDARF
jgi:hypothetical protein